MITTDPLTGRTFQPRRSNQKFESRVTQIRFNNMKAKKRRQSMANINKPLNKNFQILNEIMSSKKEGNFHKQFLIGKGFSFGVHTHYENYGSKTYNAIYNFIIVPIDKELIKIVRI
jgi:hypothetical protein